MSLHIEMKFERDGIKYLVSTRFNDNGGFVDSKLIVGGFCVTKYADLAHQARDIYMIKNGLCDE